MDTFEFKIKCFCLIIFLTAFALITKAQIDPHSLPTKTVVTASYDYAISGGEDFKASVYIEENQYFFYTSSFDKKFTTSVSTMLLKRLGKPAYQEDNIMEWETIDGQVIRSLYISLEHGVVKIKSRNLTPKMLETLQNLVETVNKIVGAKLIVKSPEISIANIQF